MICRIKIEIGRAREGFGWVGTMWKLQRCREGEGRKCDDGVTNYVLDAKDARDFTVLLRPPILLGSFE